MWVFQMRKRSRLKKQKHIVNFLVSKRKRKMGLEGESFFARFAYPELKLTFASTN